MMPHRARCLAWTVILCGGWLAACQPLGVPALRWPIVRPQPSAPTPAVPAVAPARPADPLPPDPEPMASDSAGVARLLRLAAVWQTVALHHPWVATRGVAWDSATVIAVHRVRAATTEEALTQAYDALLAALHDPVSRLEPRPVRETAPVPVTVERLDSVRVVHLPPTVAADAADAQVVVAAVEGLPARVVLDWRGAPAADPRAAALTLERLVMQGGLVEALLRGTVPGSAERRRRVGGARSDADALPDAWEQDALPWYHGEAVTSRRIVALVDAGTVLPPAILAMQAAGHLTVVADGAVREMAPVSVVRVPITETVAVAVRITDRVNATGQSVVVPDTVIAHAASGDAAREAALALVRRSGALPRATSAPSPLRAPAVLPLWQDTVSYPYLGARVLAGYRLWSAMRTQYAHRDLMDDDLDGVFARTVPRLEAARSADAYAAALNDLAVSLDDSEGEVRGPAMEAVLGTAALPFRARLVEGRAIITDVLRDPAVTAAGVSIGTELVAIDGFPITAWLTEHRRAMPAANDWSRTTRLMSMLGRGANGEVLVRVRDAANKERTLTIPRRLAFRDALPVLQRPTSAPVRALAEGIVGLDLERITPTQIDSLMRGTSMPRGVVLDLRGPLSPALSTNDTLLLRWLATRSRALVARVVHRTLTAPCAASPRDAAQTCADLRETRPLWRTIDTSAVTPPRVVALVDERTQGAAERLALQLDAFTAVTFVGGTTAGAVSPTVSLALPGQLTVAIALQEWRRADGSQVQRVGLTPLVEVRPSVRGVRAGEDEVLMRAVQWLQQRLESAPRRRR